MRFLMMVKANKESEAEKMPSEELLDAMGKYNEELKNAGALVELAGLQPSSKGFRVKFFDGKKTIIDGPFAETKELVAGFWIIDVKSREEALSWAKRIPDPFGKGNEAVVEVRPFYEFEDFEPSPAIERAKKRLSDFRAEKSHKNQ
jgi:hypothetical protein